MYRVPCYLPLEVVFPFFFSKTLIFASRGSGKSKETVLRHIGMKIIFLAVNFLCDGLAATGKRSDFGQFARVLILFLR